MPTRRAELSDIESYYDTVPRSTARVEEIGAFALFVSNARHPYYARPRRVAAQKIRVADVEAVRARQRELGVPEAFEWVDDLQPDLAATARDAGLVVLQLPLLVHRGGNEVRPPAEITVRVLPAADPALTSVQLVIGLGFAHPGTDVGLVGDAQLSDAEQDLDAHQLAAGEKGTRDRIASGDHVVVGAFAAAGAVAGGSHSPRDGVTEITGVATLPAYRRRGIGAAVAAALTADARDHGAAVCFLSAGSDDVARVYERAGFERVGTACIAGAPG